MRGKRHVKIDEVGQGQVTRQKMDDVREKQGISLYKKNSLDEKKK